MPISKPRLERLEQAARHRWEAAWQRYADLLQEEQACIPYARLEEICRIMDNDPEQMAQIEAEAIEILCAVLGDSYPWNLDGYDEAMRILYNMDEAPDATDRADLRIWPESLHLPPEISDEPKGRLVTMQDEPYPKGIAASGLLIGAAHVRALYRYRTEEVTARRS